MKASRPLRARWQSFLARLPSRWWWLPRATARVALALLALYLLYLIAGNVLINTSLGERIANRKPDRFQMQWTGGSTWWPGRVALDGVRMRGHVARNEWWLEADEARGRVALLPLLGKRVRVPWVEAVGVSGGLKRARTERPRPPARAGGWVLDFERIVARDVRDGWLHGLHVRGRGQGELAFYKQLRGGAFELRPSHARFEATRLDFDGGELLRDGTLDARFALARHTREQASGIDKLRLLELDVEVDGRSTGLQVDVAADGRVDVGERPGRGTVEGRVAFSRGALAPGGRLHWRMPVDGRMSNGLPHAQTLDVVLAVDRDLHLRAQAPRGEASAVSLDADVRVRGTQLPLRDFGSLLPRTSGHVVGQWQFRSLRWLTALFGDTPWLALDGAGRVDADVRVVDGRVAGGSRISVPEVDATVLAMGNRIRGRAQAEARLQVDARGHALPELDLRMQRFDLAAADAPSRPYVDGRNLRLEVRSVRGIERDLLQRDGGLVQVATALRAHLVFSDAHVPDLRAYNHYLPSRQLRFDGGTGALSGDLVLDGAGVGHGSVRVVAKGARLHAAGIALRGDVRIDTRLRRLSVGGHRFNVDGSQIRLDGISFREPDGDQRSGWWARIDLQRARMDWQRPATVDARVGIEMKDVGFLLALFSRKHDYPKWVYKLIDDGQARISGNVRVQRDTVTLDRLAARNDRYQLDARLRLRQGQRSGSLYARWGVLQMAVATNNGRRDFHLVRPRQWYDAQPDLLR